MSVPFLKPLARLTTDFFATTFAIVLDLFAAIYFLLLTLVIISIDIFTLVTLASVLGFRAFISLNVDSADRYITKRMVRPRNGVVLAAVKRTMVVSERVDEDIKASVAVVVTKLAGGYGGPE